MNPELSKEDLLWAALVEGDPDLALQCFKDHHASLSSYEHHVLKSAILKSPLCAFSYARLLDKRILEVEEAILKHRDPMIASLYAVYVMRARWKEAEPLIFTRDSAYIVYGSFLYDLRWHRRLKKWILKWILSLFLPKKSNIS